MKDDCSQKYTSGVVFGCSERTRRLIEKDWQAKNGRVLNRFNCASGDEILNLFREIEEEVENQVRLEAMWVQRIRGVARLQTRDGCT